MKYEDAKNFILEQHQKWLRTFGVEGERLDLSNANLSHAILTSANLDHADLTGTKLFLAIFHEADCQSAMFTKANLQNADFREAILDRGAVSWAEQERERGSTKDEQGKGT
jgi:uncharacterized protein YjbI with pentapeptide repeats